MQHCLDPIPVGYLPGQMPRSSPVYGKSILDAVACGKCKACRANRKQDWTGRLVAESIHSSQVVFSTLTYKEEPERFRYSDIQTMLRKMRDDIRYKDTTIRFFCVGEKGTLHNRKHWHMLLFFSKQSGLIRWGRDTHPGQLWEHWPHGWADIQPLDPGEWAYKIRYCVKYCLKDSAGDERYPCKSSLKPGVGDAFFRELAERMANNGLAPNGKYQHQDMCWSKGRKRGEVMEFSMTGATRYNFITYWRRAWMRRYGNGEQCEALADRYYSKTGIEVDPELFYEGREIPVNDWLLAFDKNATFPLKEFPLYMKGTKWAKVQS